MTNGVASSCCNFPFFRLVMRLGLAFGDTLLKGDLREYRDCTSANVTGTHVRKESQRKHLDIEFPDPTVTVASLNSTWRTQKQLKPA